MSINDIITKHYDELHGYCDPDKVISLGRTEEDILHNVMVTAMRKFKEKDITEKQGMDYLKLTLWNEQHFQMARKKKDKLIFVENITDYEILPFD